MTKLQIQLTKCKSSTVEPTNYRKCRPFLSSSIKTRFIKQNLKFGPNAPINMLHSRTLSGTTHHGLDVWPECREVYKLHSCSSKSVLIVKLPRGKHQGIASLIPPVTGISMARMDRNVCFLSETFGIDLVHKRLIDGQSQIEQTRRAAVGFSLTRQFKRFSAHREYHLNFHAKGHQDDTQYRHRTDTPRDSLRVAQHQTGPLLGTPLHCIIKLVQVQHIDLRRWRPGVRRR